MRAIAAVLAVLTLNAQDTASVRGRVTDAVTGKPLRNARVVFTPPFRNNQSRPPSRSTATDASGAFEVTALAAGDYHVEATPPRGEYLVASYGARALGGAGQLVHVAGGARLDVTLQAWPAASLAGRVIDTRGRP